MTTLITILADRLGLTRLVAGIVAWGAILLVASGAVFTVYEVIKHKGAEEVRAQIEKENQDAVNKGIEASRSFRDCNDAGGLWDFRRQRCSRATLGPR